MTSQKLENLLNLALNSAEDEREKSLNLNVGYDPLEREWDLIIKYSVNLDRVRKIASKVTELQNEYAVIRITESRIDILSEIPEVEYVEKPKRLFFQAAEGRRVSCINAVQDTRLSLYGQGILVAIIDSGIDYANIDFRNADGSTRIRYLWDQSLNPADGETAPVGYSIGVEYTKGQIDEALNAQTVSEQRRLVRSQDISGHGTAVAGIYIDFLGNAVRTWFPIIKQYFCLTNSEAMWSQYLRYRSDPHSRWIDDRNLYLIRIFFPYLDTDR